MSTFSTYSHIEKSVEAIQLTVETQGQVAAALGKESAALLFNTYSAIVNSSTNCLEFVFRYKTDSVDSTLTIDNYLVRINSGQYITRTKDEFLKDYVFVETDPSLPVGAAETAANAIAMFLKPWGVNSPADLTPEICERFIEEIGVTWFDAALNTVTIKFDSAGMNTFADFGTTMALFPQGSFTNSATKYVFSFENGTYAPEAGMIRNQFNYVELDSLIGELKMMPDFMKNNIQGINFSTVSALEPNAIAPSVTEAQWADFVAKFTAATKATTADVKR